MSGKSYRDLEVWKEARILVVAVYKATETFPKNQQYSLVQQLQRAAVSVSSNIAEGYGRKTPGEFLYHLRVARGSLCELETLMILAQDLAFVSGRDFDTLDERIQRTGRLLGGLLRYLESKAESEHRVAT